MIFIRWRSCVQSVWCPRLLGGGGGRLPALITRRLEAGGRFPVRSISRNLPRLRNLPSAEQLPLVRRREGEWSSDYHHQPAQPAANNSEPLPSHEIGPNIF